MNSTSNLDLLGNKDLMLFLSLREVTRNFGEDGLKQRLFYEIEDTDWDDETKHIITDLAHMVTDIYHAGDKRDDSTYATHVLRVTNRLVSRDHFNYRENPQLVIAALLHDVIEDHPERLQGEPWLDDSDMTHEGVAARIAQRDRALQVIATTYGKDVAETVRSLSNPIYNKSDLTLQEKHEIYREHVVETLSRGGDAALIKLSDFIDNCLGLGFNPDNEHRFKLAQKYAPLIPKMLEYSLNSVLSDETKTKLANELFYAFENTRYIIDTKGEKAKLPNVARPWEMSEHTLAGYKRFIGRRALTA